MATYSELEQLMLDRWSDVQALTEAFESLHDIMGRHLEKAAETLRPWLRQNGYELEVDKKYADLKAFRAGWTGQDGEPFVHLVFGGIYPAGYRRVESKSPYEWVYAQGISDARRPEFGVELRAAMGNTADEWQDPDVNDDQPAGRYLTQYTEADQIDWTKDAEKLREAAKKHFEVLFKLADAVEHALGKLKASGLK